LWDNDTTGMNYSQKFCTLYSLIPIFVPDGSGTKDISDYYRMFGKDKTRELLENITDGIKEREKGEEDHQVKAVE
jgi:hypothetical protein